MIFEKIIAKELDPEFQKLWKMGFFVRVFIVAVGFVGFAIYRINPFFTMSRSGAFGFCWGMMALGVILGVQLQTYDFMLAFGKIAYASKRRSSILFYWVFSIIWYVLLLTITVGGIIYFSLQD